MLRFVYAGRLALARASVRTYSSASPATFAAAKKEGEPTPFVKEADGTVTFNLNECASHRCDPPPTSVNISKDEFVKMYEEMYTIRRLETLSDSLYKQRLVKGFLHLYSGQEAVATGIEHAITKKDSVITAYRCHGFQYLRGDTVDRIIAELCGKEAGCSKGKGGSMHMYLNNFFGGNGIVGAHVPVGAGIAFAHKYNKTKEVCVCAYGDGAANQGQLFETFNMASLWRLPVIFVVENNMYAMGTSTTRSYAGNVYYTRGDFVPGLLVDGMNVLAVKGAMDYAVNWARNGKGPMILEMKTYRYSGHSLSDPGTSYRTRDEVQNVRESSDPIQAARAKLIASGLATEEELKEVEKNVKKVVQNAEKFARDSPSPTPDALWKDIYHEDVFVRGVELLNSHVPK
jgi:pyruvate dehydrogenase E1 component alpha subunit